MQDILDHILSHPWIVALMVLCFLLCMALFRARVRREHLAKQRAAMTKE